MNSSSNKEVISPDLECIGHVQPNIYFLCFFSPCAPSQTIPKTLNPQWREQFDFHLYDEQGGFVDITVWDKDAGKKDDFMGRYVAQVRTQVALLELCASHCCAVCTAGAPLTCRS